MKRNLIKTTTLFFVLIPLFFISSCDNQTGKINASDDTSGETIDHTEQTSTEKYGTVQIAEKSMAARTIIPNGFDITSDDFYFVLSGLLEDDDSLSITKTWATDSDESGYSKMTGDSFELRIGTWDFIIDVYKSTDVGNVKVYTKSISMEIEEGSNILDFGALKEAEEGEGTFGIKLTFPKNADVKTVNAVLYLMDGSAAKTFNQLELQDGDEDYQYVTVPDTSVECGDYRIKFTLYNSKELIVKTYRELLHVAPADYSYAEREVTEVNTVYKITYMDLDSYNSISGYSMDDSYELPFNYNESQTINIPSGAVKNEYYYVAAWYDNEKLEGNPVTGWNPGDKAEDIVLYPKWYVSAENTSGAISNLSEFGSNYTLRISGEIGSYTTSIKSALKSISTTVSIQLIDATSIPSEAFEGCTALREITIPASVTTIGDYAFDGCSGLKKITIEDSATALSLGYGYGSGEYRGLFYGSRTSLSEVYIGRDLDYSSGDDYGYSPFANITSLTKATLGDGVTSIKSFLFYGCNGLSEIIIGKKLPTVNTYAFYSCTGLTTINYKGNETQWNAMTIQEYNDPLKNLIPNYNYIPEDAVIHTVKYTTVIGTAPQDKIVEDGEELVDTDLPAITAAGGTFIGWYLDSTYETGVEAGYIVTEDITLYAQFNIDTYKISYVMNGGKRNSDNPSTYTVTDEVELEDPTYTGKTFAGWYTDESCTQKITKIAKGSTGDLTLYARWGEAGGISIATKEYNDIEVLYVTNGDYITFTGPDFYSEYEWRVDGAKCQINSYKLTLDTSSWSSGRHTIILIVKDTAADIEKTSTVYVTID